MNDKNILKAINACIDVIAHYQEPDGSIPSVSSHDKTFKDETKSMTTFHTSLTLSAIAQARHPLVGNIVSVGIKFLVSQKSSIGSINYWKRGIHASCPDDLDDTFLGHSAIALCDLKLIDEKVMLECIELLIHNEINPGGPYYTWLVQDHVKPWADVDVGVNANIGRFLSIVGIDSFSLVAYIENAIKEKIISQYYSSLAIMYFLSSWYRGKMVQECVRAIIKRRKKNGIWNTPLETALAISSLLKFGIDPHEVEGGISYLTTVAAEKKFSPYPFYIEEIKNGIPIYSGSAITTAACIAEALSLHMQKNRQNIHRNKLKKLTTDSSVCALKRFQKSPLKRKVQKLLEVLITKDTHHEIVLTPKLFAQKGTERKAIIDLAAANMLGWLGYSIYDDILDGDGNIELLPIANICVREVTDIFKTILPEKKMYRVVQTILDEIDEANYWEHENSKLEREETVLFLPEKLPSYGDYTILAKKSFGHALGPITLSISRKETNKRILHIQDFFTHYLIAKQLNDDAHDWLIDLEKGFLNSVNVDILKQWRKNTRIKRIDIRKEKEILQKIFWEGVIDEAAENILFHTAKAREILKLCGLDKNEGYFQERLDGFASSANTAITERDTTKRFLESYEARNFG